MPDTTPTSKSEDTDCSLGHGYNLCEENVSFQASRKDRYKSNPPEVAQCERLVSQEDTSLRDTESLG